MKATVSVPDDVLAAAERLGRRMGKSRNQIFTDALREYIALRAAGDVSDEFVKAAAMRVLERTEW